MSTTTGQGSAGNVIAALCDLLLVPGLGHLIQGRVLAALGWFVFACLAGAVTWVFTLGLLPFGWVVVAVLACISSATYKRP